MKTSFLDFEQPIAELEQKIEELRFVQDDSAVDISQEIERLSKKSRELTKEIYAKLTAWQISKVARHPQRPYTLDYIARCCTDFQELHGDRMYADDHSLVGGLARLENEPVVVIGHDVWLRRFIRNCAPQQAPQVPAGVAKTATRIHSRSA